MTISQQRKRENKQKPTLKPAGTFSRTKNMLFKNEHWGLADVCDATVLHGKSRSLKNTRDRWVLPLRSVCFLHTCLIFTCFYVSRVYCIWWFSSLTGVFFFFFVFPCFMCESAGKVMPMQPHLLYHKKPNVMFKKMKYSSSPQSDFCNMTWVKQQYWTMYFIWYYNIVCINPSVKFFQEEAVWADIHANKYSCMLDDRPF